MLFRSNGAAIRTYGGNDFAVSAPKNIKKVVITFGSSDGTNQIKVDSGTLTGGTWEGNSTSVKFTIDGTSGNRRIAAIEVTYEK